MSTYAYPPPANPKVEPCPACGSKKPLGAKYHAPLLPRAAVDDPTWPECQEHGRKFYVGCTGEHVPPSCCW